MGTKEVQKIVDRFTPEELCQVFKEAKTNIRNNHYSSVSEIREPLKSKIIIASQDMEVAAYSECLNENS